MPRFDNLSAEELEQIRRFIEETDIDVISDEMRTLVEKNWPWLLEKLPPRVTHCPPRKRPQEAFLGCFKLASCRLVIETVQRV
jgi:hypothetical protein